MLGIDSVFWPVVLRSISIGLVIVAIDLMALIVIPLVLWRRPIASKALLFLLLGVSLVFSSGIALLLSARAIVHFRAATRVKTACPAQPAWVDTYAGRVMTGSNDPAVVVYGLFADIAPRDTGAFPKRGYIEIDRGFNSSSTPSPILRHAPGTVYLSGRPRDPIVIEVDGRYYCSK